MVWLPAALDLALGGWRRVFSWFAQDAFYYLTVGRNVARSGIFSFDQTWPTNGFHPLWQWVIALEAWVADRIFADADVALMLSVFWTSLALLGAGVGLLAWGGACWTGGAAVLLLGMPLGVYALAAWGMGLDVRYATTWYGANGMETGLCVFWFGVLAVLLLREGECSGMPWWRIGIALGMLVLSRLDVVFVLPAFGITMLLCHGGNRRAWSGPTKSMVLASGIIGAYMVWNQLALGSWMPVSGGLKTSFPELVDRNWEEWGRFIAGKGDAQPDRSVRIALMFVPLLAVTADMMLEGLLALRHGIAAIGWRAAARLKLGSAADRRQIGEAAQRARAYFAANPWRRWLLLARLMVIGLHLYNICYVYWWHQGFWYYPLSLLVLSLICVDRAGALAGRLNAQPLQQYGRPAWAVVVMLLLGVQAWMFETFVRSDERNVIARVIFEDRHAVWEHYGATAPRLIAMDDGLIAYATGYPTMSGLGLCLDPEGIEAFRRRALLMLAWQRGFRRVALSLHVAGKGLRKESSPAEVMAALQADNMVLMGLGPHRFEEMIFRVDYLNAERSYGIFEFRPMHEAAWE